MGDIILTVNDIVLTVGGGQRENSEQPLEASFGQTSGHPFLLGAKTLTLFRNIKQFCNWEKKHRRRTLTYEPSLH